MLTKVNPPCSCDTYLFFLFVCFALLTNIRCEQIHFVSVAYFWIITDDLGVLMQLQLCS